MELYPEIAQRLKIFRTGRVPGRDSIAAVLVAGAPGGRRKNAQDPHSLLIPHIHVTILAIMIASALISLESRSARVAAVLDARPALALTWRRCVACSEAAASLSLEGVPVREETIAAVDLALGPGQGDPQSIAAARSITAALMSRKNAKRDPDSALSSAIDAARWSSLVDVADGGRSVRIGQTDPDMKRAIVMFREAVPAILTHDGPIVGKCIAAAHLLAGILPERLPMAERLMFAFVEHGLRNHEFSIDPITSRNPRSRQPGWIMTPSLALSRNGLRSWSPETRSGRETLIARLDRALRIEAGRLGQLNSWDDRRQAFRKRRQGGNTASLANLLERVLVVDTETVARRCAVTTRTARNLIDAAQEDDLLHLLTPRRAYRVWAVPALAQMIADRHTGRTTGETRMPALSPGTPDTQAPGGDTGGGADTTAMSNALDALDRAIADADRHLERYHETVAARRRNSPHRERVRE